MKRLKAEGRIQQLIKENAQLIKTQKRLEEQNAKLSLTQIEISEFETKVSKLSDTIVTLEQELLSGHLRIKTVISSAPIGN